MNKGYKRNECSKCIKREIDIKELQNIFYHRFFIIHNFLVANGIQYFAVEGTLLGAVRNGGMVPWDDDIDIAMTRDNYNKFLSLANKLDKKYFFIDHYSLKKTVNHALARICFVGVEKANNNYVLSCANNFAIDVFPLDSVTKNKNTQNKIIKKCLFYKKMIYYKTRSLKATKIINKPLLMLLKVVLLPFATNFLAKKHDEVATIPSRLYKSQLDDFLWISNGAYSYINELHSMSVFKSAKLIPFSNYHIYAPMEYKTFLIDCYGSNYMTPFIREKNDGVIALLTDDFIYD